MLEQPQAHSSETGELTPLTHVVSGACSRAFNPSTDAAYSLIRLNVHSASAGYEAAAHRVLIQHLRKTRLMCGSQQRWEVAMRSAWYQTTRCRGGRDNPAPSHVNHIIYPCVGTHGAKEGGREPALSPKFFLMLCT